MNFQDLRRKAESAASTARLAHSLSSSPLGQKLVAASAQPSLSAAERPRTPPEPVKPSLASQRGENTPSCPSQSQRFANSTSLQLQASRNAPPPPPTRRVGEGGRAVPPARAAKPAGLAAAGASSSRAGAPPPAPPPRVGSAAPLPVDPPRPVPAPPYAAALAPTLPARSHPAAKSPSDFEAPTRRKRFDEYDERDKGAFFEVLDEFFSSRLTMSTTTNDDTTSHPVPPATPPLTARPASTPASSSSSSSDSCAALSLLHSLLHPSPSQPPPFSTLFFLSPPQVTSHLPPFLLSRSDHRTAFSWSQTTPSRMTHLACAVFADSSVAWWKIDFDPSLAREKLARGEGVRVEGRYRAPTKVEEWSAEELFEASEVYGRRVADFARRAVERGQPVGRGECWDLAHDALESVGPKVWAQGGEPPFPSIGRSHGALLFHASSARLDERGRIVGEWYGGDGYVRQGDVIQWRSVRIRELGGKEGSYCLLGDPEHTAIVLSPHPPSSPPSLPPSPPYSDPSYPLSSLTALTVAEQSLSHPPSIRTYDLGTMDEGEVWIYRPASMRRVTGVRGVETGWEELDREGVEYQTVR
ncbi:Altered inheritance of mitochondria protein 3 [Rhodotorula toruloides]|nr:Altered inheritance of mitochondria protein 3 [Rhodotorula toruloides]